jgi:hypothetical protein
LNYYVRLVLETGLLWITYKVGSLVIVTEFSIENYSSIFCNCDPSVIVIESGLKSLDARIRIDPEPDSTDGESKKKS